MFEPALDAIIEAKEAGSASSVASGSSSRHAGGDSGGGFRGLGVCCAADASELERRSDDRV